MDTKRDPFFLGNKKKEGYQKKEQKNGDAKKEWKQKKFDKNRLGLENGKNTEKVAKEKKPFDKKLYRLKKYSNKYKLDQWEEQRKKKLLKNFYKETENDPMVGTYKPVNFEDETDGQVVGKYVRHPDIVEKEEPPIQNVSQKKDPSQKAKERFDKIKQEKEEKRLEAEKAKEEKKQKILEYKKKKQERFKKLSKKTKKGQPVMTGRLELLLEKIQKN